jgi:beta-lactamase regulating signal transducer with metallopeptidase domain
MSSFPLLIEAALRALLVGLVVWAGLRLLRVGNVLAQKAVWALVLAAAVAMPLLMRWHGIPAFTLLRVPVPALHPAAQTAPAAQLARFSASTSELSSSPLPGDWVESQPAASTGGRFPAPANSIGASAASSPATSLPIQPERRVSQGLIAHQPLVPNITWQLLAAFLYLAVAAALIVRVAFGLATALRIWLSAERVYLENDQEHFPGLHLRSSCAIASPVTIGSAVLLPARYVDWDAEKLRIVLAHERSHIRQGDFYLQLLAALYAAIFWFSPLGWWLKSKLRNLGEAIGDHAALNQAASPASYAQLLLEFAAMPRPTLIGVAMARPSTISQRIERLLNDSTFRKAFAEGKSRAMIAVLIVPVAIFAATTLVRVEAARATQPQAPSSAAPAAPASPGGPTAPSDAKVPAEPTSADAAPQAPDATPASRAADGADSVFPPRPPQAPAVPSATGKPGQPSQYNVPQPPDPPTLIEDTDTDSDDAANTVIIRDHARDQRIASVKMMRDGRVFQVRGPDGDHSGYFYSVSNNGESYAIVSGPDAKIQFSGDWNGATSEDIEKARKMAHGKFLWFKRDGKSYIVEDPALIAQIEEMRKPMEVLGREQAELGRKQAELGKQQGEFGKQMQFAKITAPDISKEMAEITAAMTKLQAQMGEQINREQLAEVQGKLAQLQGKLGSVQGRFGAAEGDWGSKMGKLGAEQGELGAQQGKLGAEQGKLAVEADKKTKAIIDQSLHNGQAKPVE